MNGRRTTAKSSAAYCGVKETQNLSDHTDGAALRLAFRRKKGAVRDCSARGVRVCVWLGSADTLPAPASTEVKAGPIS